MLLQVDADGRIACWRASRWPATGVGHGPRLLRLLAREVVAVGICDTTGHETINQTLNRMVRRDATCSSSRFRPRRTASMYEYVTAMQDLLSTYEDP